MALAIVLALGPLVFFPFDVLGRGSGRSGSSTPRSSFSASSQRRALSSSQSSIECASCPRDSQGKITRDLGAVLKFKRTHPQPPGCLQGEVDNGVPLSQKERTG